MKREEHRVVMVASENDALAGGKVGGVGDVIKGLPEALSRQGWHVTTILPSYGFLHKINPSKLHSVIHFPFEGQELEGEFWQVEGRQKSDCITHFVFEHPAIRGERIYINDPPETPFKHDASKYAMFCSAVGQFLERFNPPFVLHLHDWHAATLLLLRELYSEFFHLDGVKTVFTIHNLAIQGTRPIRGDESSVERWFPELFEDPEWVAGWKDPRYEVPCFTPMLAGIQLADKVNTVSPSYADEIVLPGDNASGFHGGEGLEMFLRRAKDENRLFGILNGLDYDLESTARLPIGELCDLMFNELAEMGDGGRGESWFEAIHRIERLKKNPPDVLLTSITRIVEQKTSLLMAGGSNGEAALERILKSAEGQNGVYVLLGTGTVESERQLADFSRDHERFIFLNCCSPVIAQSLYANGSLFLMPSMFEPCGISQMMAMREGQPCIVHAVGGLKDTVIDNVNGFSFSGRNLKEKADGLVDAVQRALRLRSADRQSWIKIKEEAARQRFTWDESAKRYIELLYR